MAYTSSTLSQEEFFRTEFLKHPNQDELENNALVATTFYKKIAKKWQSINSKMDVDLENQPPLLYTFSNFARDIEEAHAVGSDKENFIDRDVDMDVEVDAIANIMNVMHLTASGNGVEANSVNKVNAKVKAGEGESNGGRKRESSAASSPKTDDCDMEPAIPKKPSFHPIV